MTTGQISIVIVVGEVRRLIFLGHSVKEAFCPVAFYPEALCPEFGNNNPVNRLFLSQCTSHTGRAYTKDNPPKLILTLCLCDLLRPKKYSDNNTRCVSVWP